MKEEIKIAIFGLSLNILSNMRVKLRSIFDESVHLTWANITDPQLDILLVNDMFYNSPTIQAFVNSNHVPYLRLVNDINKSGTIEGDILYLPFSPTDQIRSWFNNSYVEIPNMHERKPHTPMIKTDKKADFVKVIKEFLNERNGNIQVFDRLGNIAIINTLTQQVWVDETREVMGSDESINYTYATMQMMKTVSVQQGHDTKIWLWNLLWFSPNLLTELPPEKFYKLNCWPQPNLSPDRQEIFKLAACFEQGASIYQVEKNTQIQKFLIDRFVSVSVLCKAMIEVPQSEAHYLAVDTVTDHPLKDFFGGLKNKLRP